MEKPRTDSEPGLVPYHDNGNGFHGAENQDLENTKSSQHKEDANFIIVPDQVSYEGLALTKTDEEATRVMELSPRQFQYYRVVSSLINQPNFTFKDSKNASGKFAQELNLSPREWEEIYRKLKNRLNVISFTKNNRNNPRLAKAVSLDVEGLLIHAQTARDPSFVTIGVLETLKERLTQDDINLGEHKKIKYITDLTDLIEKKLLPTPTPEELAADKRRRDVEANRRWKQKKYGPPKPRRKKKTHIQDKPVYQINQPVEEKPNRKPEFMSFAFAANSGEYFTRAYRIRTFRRFEPTIKLLHALGQSSSFTEDRAYQEKYAQGLINKGVKEEEKLDSQTYSELLAKAEEDGLVISGGSTIRVTSEAISVLENTRVGKANAEKETLPEDQEKVSEELPDDTKESSYLEFSPALYFELIDYMMPMQWAEKIRTGEFKATEWLHPQNNTKPVVEYLAFEFNANSERFKKKLRALKNDGYIDLIYDTEESGRAIINIGLTAGGAVFWKDYEDKLIERQREEVDVDINKIELLDLITASCINIALDLGKTDMAEVIMSCCHRDEYVTATENDENYLNSEITRFEEIFAELQKEKTIRSAGELAIAA